MKRCVVLRIDHSLSLIFKFVEINIKIMILVISNENYFIGKNKVNT